MPFGFRVISVLMSRAICNFGHSVTDVIPRIKHSFYEALGFQNVIWEASCCKRSTIAKRYAHSACRHREYRSKLSRILQISMYTPFKKG